LQQQLQQRKTFLQKYFRDSETILVARFTAISGFATAVIGGLDWSPLLGMSGFDRKQVIVMGGVVLLIGISHEIARRMRSDAQSS
jgi:hypothetical protein